MRKRGLLPLVGIHPWSLESCWPDISTLGGTRLGNAVSNAYPVADLALFVPFYVCERSIITKIYWANGAAVAGNVDMRVYTEAGTAITPSVQRAQAVINSIQEVDIADVPIDPGLFFMAIVLSNVGGTLVSGTLFANQAPATMGMAQQQLGAGAALPDIAVMAQITGNYIPALAVLISPRTVI
jgi:hypothetical protein